MLKENQKKQSRQPDDELDAYLSLTEASGLCSYSQEYLSLLARKGLIGAVKMGRNWVITRRALFDYIEKNQEGIKGNRKGNLAIDEKIKFAVQKSVFTSSLAELVKKTKALALKSVKEGVRASRQAIEGLPRKLDRFLSTGQRFFTPLALKRVVAVLLIVSSAVLSIAVSPVAAKYYQNDFQTIAKLANATIGKSFKAAKQSFDKTAEIYQDTFEFAARPRWSDVEISAKYLARGFNNLGQDIYQGSFILANNFSNNYLAAATQKLSQLSTGLSLAANQLVITPENTIKILAALNEGKFSPKVFANLSRAPRELAQNVFKPVVDSYRELGIRTKLLVKNRIEPTILAVSGLINERIAREKIVEPRVAGVSEEIVVEATLRESRDPSPLDSSLRSLLGVQDDRRADNFLAAVGQSFVGNLRFLKQLATDVYEQANVVPQKFAGIVADLSNRSQILARVFDRVGDGLNELSQLSFAKFKDQLKRVRTLSKLAYENIFIEKRIVVSEEQFLTLEQAKELLGPSAWLGTDQITNVQYITTPEGKVVGIVGPAGPQGPQGLAGPQGQAGPQGESGEAGGVFGNNTYSYGGTTVYGGDTTVVQSLSAVDSLAVGRGGLGVGGNLTVSASVELGDGRSGHTLTVNNPATFNNSLTVAAGQNTSLGGSLSVSGTTVFAGDVNIGNTTIKGSSGNIVTTAKVGIGATTTPSADLTITGSSGQSENLITVASSSGTNLLTFSPTGNLELNTTSTSATLTVRQAGIGDLLNLYDGSTVVLTVINGGRVGIGTTTPAANLTIGGVSGQTNDLLTIASSTGASLVAIDSLGNVSLQNNLTVGDNNNWSDNDTLTVYATSSISATGTAPALLVRQGGTGDFLRLASTTIALRVVNTGQTILSAYPKTSAPALLVQPYDISSFDQSTSTMLMVNASPTFTGDLLSLETDGSPKFRVDYQGNAIYFSTVVYNGDVDPGLDKVFDQGDLLTTKRWRDIALYRNLYVGATSTVSSAPLAKLSSTTLAFYNTNFTIQNPAGTQNLLLQPSGGNVGIGTTTPAGRLAVAGGTASNQPLIVADAPSAYAGRVLDLKVASTSKLVFTSAGSLGLGTTTPVAQLAVQTTQGQTTDLFRLGTTSSGYLATTTDFSYVKVTAEGDTTIKGKVLNPVFLAEEQPGGANGQLDGAFSVFVSGNYAYVANRDRASLAVIDISNPADPVFVAEEQNGTLLSRASSVFVSGNYAYVANSGFGRNSLAVIDISNPADPVFVAEERGPTPGTSLAGANSVFVSGNYAYVANNSRDSLAVIDISNPADPVFVAEERPGGANGQLDGAFSVFVSGNYAYVANFYRNSLAIIDISNPADPVFVAEERGPTPGTSLAAANSVFVSGNYAYVANYGRNSLAIIDISNPADPVFVAEEQGPTPDTSLAAAASVFVSGNYAYVANFDRSSLAVIDISNPADPVFVAEERGPTPDTSLAGAISVFVSGNYAYVANLDRDSLAVIDVSGLTVSNAEIGTLKVSNLQVESYAQFAQGALIQGGLNVGQESLFGGPVAINVSTSTISFGAEVLKVTATSSVDLVMFSQQGTGRILGLYDGVASSTISNNLAFAVNNGGYTQIYATSTQTALTVRQGSSGDLFNVYDGSALSFTLNAAGNLGLGTSTPSARLAIARGTSDSQPMIRVDAPSAYAGRLLDLKTASSSMFYVDSSGNTNIQGTLTVAGSQFTATQTSLATTTISATGTATVLTIRQGGTGDILNLLGGNSEVLTVLNSGYTGIGTTTPYSVLSISTLSQAASSTKLFTVASTTGATLFNVNASGKVGVGLNNPSAYLQVTAASEQLRVAYDSNNYASFSVASTGYLNFQFNGAGVGAQSVFQASTTGIVFNVPASLGNIVAAEDLGVHTLYNQPVSSSLTQGTKVGPTFSLDSSPVLTVYGESDGSGGVQNLRVGIGTTTPYSVLSVSTLAQATSTTKLFTVASTTGRILFTTLASGETGVGTSTPVSRLSVSTNAQMSPTYKLFTVASTTGATLFQVLGSGAATFNGALTLNSTLNVNNTLTLQNGATLTNSAAALLTITEDNINLAGNTGIGTTTPAGRLAVAGGTASNQPLIIADAPASYAGRLLDLKTASSSMFYVDSSGNTSIQGNLTVAGAQFTSNQASFATTTISATGTATILTVRQGGTGDILNLFDGAKEVLTVLDGGNIGIGTTTPGARLSVTRGPGSDATLIMADAPVAFPGWLLDLKTASTTRFLVNAAGRTTIGTTYQSTAQFYASSTNVITALLNQQSTNDILQLQQAGKLMFVSAASGNIGIGTTTPGARLSVTRGPGADATLIMADAPAQYTGNLLDLKIASTTYFVVKGIYDTASHARVGIGTTTPQARLSISSINQSSVDFLRIASTTNANIFTITAGGRVGIATGTPVARLSVTKTSADATDFLRVASTTAGQLVFNISHNAVFSYGKLPTWQFQGFNAAGGTYIPLFTASTSDTVTLGTEMAINYLQSSPNPGDHIFYNVDVNSGSANGLPTRAYLAIDYMPLVTLYGQSDGAGGANTLRVGVGTTTPIAKFAASSTAMITAVFDQRGSNDILQGRAAGVKKFVINSSGKVGIGTTTPAGRLAVAGGTASNQPLIIADAPASYAGRLLDLKTASSSMFYVDSSGNTSIQGNLTVSGAQFTSNQASFATTTISATGTATILTVRQGGTGDILNLLGGNTEVMTVLNSGYTGIGTTTPYSVLAVSTASQAAPETKLFTVASTTGSILMTVLANGNVGIGKANPSYTLDVNGIINGTAIYENGAPFVGSQWSDNVNDIYYSIGNVGIGTTTPAGRLAVAGGTASNQPLIIADAPAQYTGNLLDLKIASTTYFVVKGIYDTASHARVGIGTTTPQARLSISSINQSSVDFLRIASTTNANIFTITARGRVGIGTGAPSYNLDVDGTVHLSGTTTPGVTGLIIDSNGRVGIGGSPSSYKLSVNGTTDFLNTVHFAALSANRVLGLDGSRNLATAFGSANLIASLNDESGTGVAIFGTSPTFTTGITVPLVIGGTAASSNLILKSTSGVGTSDYIALQTGSAREAMRINTSGNVGIGTTTPGARLSVTRGPGTDATLIMADAPSGYTGRLLDLKTASTSQVVVLGSSGYAGFGTTTPTSVLSVSTIAQADPSTRLFTVASTTGQVLLQVLADGQIRAPKSGLCVDDDGSCTATIGTINAVTFAAAGHSDVAENYPSLENLKPGDLVMADVNNPGFVVRTTGEYNNNVIGVVSEKPGFLLAAETKGYPIALVGRISTKVTSLNGEIRPGDTLTVAPTPGYAMKLQEGDTSKIIGTALESFNGQGNVTGLISMFINPDYKSTLGKDTFGLITDGQIATNAAISDLKIATIATPGKIALSALPVEIALLQGETQTFKGNYIFGTAAGTKDLVVFNAKFGSDIKFAIDGLYNIGSASQTAANIYTRNLNASKLVVAADLNGLQDMNIDDYGLYLAASSGNAFFGDNVIVGAIHELPVQLPQYPDFVVDGGDLLVKDDLGIGGDLYVVGNVRVAGAVEFAREGIAQMMTVVGAIHELPLPGDVIVVNASGTVQGKISDLANATGILGVVATSSGAVFAHEPSAFGGGSGQGLLRLPVVVSGVTMVKVSGENGPIKKGDRLTTAETVGYAQLATRPGAGVLGMALEDLAEGQGKIKVLVDLGAYYQPTAKIVIVGESGADFKSIAKALDSIKDNSIQNRYLIKVAPGVYEEQITLKDYVDIVGEGEGLVAIQSDQSPVVTASAHARLEGLTIKSTSVAQEPVLLSISSASPVINNVSLEAGSVNPATGVSISGSPEKVSLNRLTFNSNYAQAIINLASTTVSIMHSDLSEVNGTALAAQAGTIRSYFNQLNGVLGDIYVASGAKVESTGDSYQQAANLGIFLDKTNQGKIENDYIDWGWLVERMMEDERRLTVSAGEGYINGVKVNTAEVSGVEVSASSTNYILMTDEGVVTATTTPFPSLLRRGERGGQAILIAAVQTDLNSITSISNERANEIVVAKQGGKFRTISEAMESITTNSQSNRWTIKVGSGVYNEQVVLKPFVDIVGEGEKTVVMSVGKPVLLFGSTASSQQNNNERLEEAVLPTSTPAVGNSKISNIKLSLAGDTIGQPVVSASSTPARGGSAYGGNLILEDVSISWSGDEGILGTAVEVSGASSVVINRLNAFGMAYGVTSNVTNDGSATSTLEISYSNISSTVADIRTMLVSSDGTDNEFVGSGNDGNNTTITRADEFIVGGKAHITSSYNTLSGTGTNFDVAKGTAISSAHDTYLRYTGEGEFRQNDYFRNMTNGANVLFTIQNAGLNLFNVNASGTIAINPQNTTGDSVVINSATASSTLTVINSGAGVALTTFGNIILHPSTSTLPVVLSSAGAELNIGAPGDIINLNLEGVTYNFKENVRRNTLSAYLPSPQSGDKIWGDGNNSWRPPENITVLGVKVQYSCAESGFLQMVLKDKNGATIANLDAMSCGGYDKIEVNDLAYHLTPDDGMYVDVVSAVEGVTNVTVTVEFVYDNR